MGEKISEPTPEELLENAHVILEEVDNAPIFKEETENREFPAFARKEIKMGKVLGIGGFGVVREITSFRLIVDEEEVEKKEEEPIQQDPDAAAEEREAVSSEGHTVDEVAMRRADCASPPPKRFGAKDNDHLDVNFARQIMQKRCLRHEEARYAVKHLLGLDDLTPLERARGRIDLAIEVKYLRALNHPNIVRMRGVFKTDDLLHASYFFIMDRLYGTLEEKIEGWKDKVKANRPKLCMRRLTRKDSREFTADLLTERLTIAYDMASAYRYMHSHKLIYRDTKQENIGFDIRGDVKIFDFGLAKSMNADLKTNGDGLYLLTARTGSFPYMAPEVVLGQPYNETCDVFSFTILVWEMLALKPSFLKLKTRREFKTKVVEGGARPYIPSRKWGMMTYKVLTTGWKASPKERPSMDDICTMLRTELAASEVYDEGIFANRSIFLQERSMRSMHSSMFSEKKSPRMTMAGKKQISRADTV